MTFPVKLDMPGMVGKAGWLSCPTAEMMNCAWYDRPLSDVVRTVLVNGGAFRDYAVEHALPEIGRRTINVSGSRIPGSRESSILVLLSLEEDVT